MYCIDCKYWSGNETDWDGKVRPWGKCQKIEHNFWQACDDDYEPIGEPQVSENNASFPLAFTMDGSDYRSQLNTHEKFGCILFVQREMGKP